MHLYILYNIFYRFFILLFILLFFFVIRYISLIYHDEAWVERAIQNEKKRGFIYIEDILESLEEYENQRQIYPTFDLYYPMIVKHLETVKAR